VACTRQRGPQLPALAVVQGRRPSQSQGVNHHGSPHSLACAHGVSLHSGAVLLYFVWASRCLLWGEWGFT
jgi:hypothetical protein